MSGELERAAALIREGRLVAFPTETVYGLGANALDAAAVGRIFTVKGRPSTSPLIVHVASIEMARELASVWPDAAQRLAERHWPGPLTLVVPKQPHVPDTVTAGLQTVGLRMPAHPMALELIRRSGVPIAAPSANVFMQLSPTSAEHVRAGLGAAVDMILDGGSTPVGIESTVVSLVGQRPVLLRAGMISREEIEALIGPVEVAGSADAGAHAAPGMHARHYSPRTRLVLVRDRAVPARGRGVYLAPGGRMPAEPQGYAAALYATLHELDGQGWDWIAVEEPPEEPAWEGIRDRLRRASARV
ncbi:MAG: threonylcarbamoyl-AMP synthase [Candidatus Solibacter usitatus]|nr:threonylcarbamoyl-AMP synthase [Candidatus Solibacter usitatus]